MHSFLLIIVVSARSQYGIQLRGRSGDFCSKSEEPLLFRGRRDLLLGGFCNLLDPFAGQEMADT